VFGQQSRRNEEICGRPSEPGPACHITQPAAGYRQATRGSWYNRATRRVVHHRQHPPPPRPRHGEWQDGETWFLRCSAWGDLAENITASLAKGAAVVATGRLRARTWEADDGTKRATVEMTVEDAGPSLRRAIAKVTKATREHAPDADTQHPANGKQATPAPVTVPAEAEEPAGSLPDEPPF